MYVTGGMIYQANYRSGLRIVNSTGIADKSFSEYGFFDIYPSDDSRGYNGAW